MNYSQERVISTLTRIVVKMPSRLSNVSFPLAATDSSVEVTSEPQKMMGRAKPRLPSKQTIDPKFMEGSWVLSKDENGKTTLTKE